MKQSIQEPRQQTTNEFQTRDLYLASVLRQSGIPIIKVENNGRGQGIFVFKNSEKIEKIVSDYFNDVLRVSPRGLFEHWKALKSMAFSSIGDVR